MATDTSATPPLSSSTATDRSARQVVLGCFIGLAISCPAVYNQCFGIYLNAITKETGWQRAEVSLGYTLPSLLAAILAFPVGVWIDRAGARRVILAGTIIFPVTLVALGSIPADFTFFLLATLSMGVALALVCPATYLTLPSQWFHQRIGIATAIAAMGTSVGAATMPLLTQWLVTDHGWREALWAVACLVSVIGIGNAVLLIRNAPKSPNVAKAALVLEASASVGETVRDRRFWLLAFTFFLIVLVGAGYAIHFVAILSDRGYTAGSAALTLTCFSLASLIGRPIAGVMMDRLPFWIAGAVFISGQMIGGALMLGQFGGPAPYVAAALIGAAIGAEVDIMPVTLRHMFGLRAFASIFGLAFAVFSIGSALGPLVMGLSFDQLGSYASAMIGLLLADVLALALFVLAVGNARARLPA